MDICCSSEYVIPLRRDDEEAMKTVTVPVSKMEGKRLQILRESGLLDSDTNDPEFDRLSHLCARIFGVPICFITFMKTTTVWMKSKIGLSFSEAPRNESFCNYTILPESPEVFVVPDTLKDRRFSTWGVTVNFGIRFYAGAPIELDEVRIGTLCILDTKPREGFSLVDRVNILDLASSLSILVKSRRDRNVGIASERARMLQDLSQNLRTPLTTLEMTLSTLRTGSSASVSAASIDEASNAFQQLKFFVENSLTAIRILAHRESSKDSATEMCSVIDIIEKMRALSECITDKQGVFQWDYLPLQSGLQSRNQITYPDVFQFAVINVLQKAAIHSREIILRFSFEASVEIVPVVVKEEVEGFLITYITIRLNGESGFSLADTHESTINLKTISQAIRDVGGVFDTIFGAEGQSEEEVVHIIRLPCTNLAQAESDVSKVTSIAAAAPSPPSSTRSSSDITSDPASSLRPVKVLIVEDSVPVQKAVKRFMEMLKCEVTVAENGKLGLNLLTTTTFDLVLSDYMMPVMSGPEMMKERMQWMCMQGLTEGGTGAIINEHTLVVGMSATASEAECDECFFSGMHFFAAKPVSTQVMTLLVSAAKLKVAAEENPSEFDKANASLEMLRSHELCRTIDACGADDKKFIFSQDVFKKYSVSDSCSSVTERSETETPATTSIRPENPKSFTRKIMSLFGKKSRKVSPV